MSLFRKAKNDLEEGGSNTLFLASGMLKWKDEPESVRSYRAPLILLPVELNRRSARSKIKIKQRDGEEPVFNSTLIEFLQSDYEINLSQFNEDLPKDESGVDVELIWAIVRDKVKDVPGFESAISLSELAADIGWKHNMGRTTKKQLDHIESIISDWAGIAKHSSGEITIWHSPDKIEEVVSWRGVSAFGVPREWNSIALPEKHGLAKEALQNSPSDPVDYIFKEFNLSRRTKSTTTKFESWINDFKLIIQ